MRFSLGLIIGVMLTIGTAYVVDAVHSAPGGDDQVGRQMVNWTVVDANMRGLSSDVQHTWARLVGGVRQIDKQTGI